MKTMFLIGTFGLYLWFAYRYIFQGTYLTNGREPDDTET